MKRVGSALAGVWRRLVLAIEWMMQLDRASKRAVVLTIDLSLCVLSTLLAFSLRVGAFSFPIEPPLIFLAIAVPAFIITFNMFGVYATIFRFSGARTIFQLARASVVYSIPLVLIFLVFGMPGIPRTVGLLQPMIFVGFVALSRMLLRHLLLEIILPKKFGGLISRVLIYGAGSAGQQLATSLRHQPGFLLGGFIDDDPNLRGQRIDGLPIFHREDLHRVLQTREIDTVLLALPRVSRSHRRKIVESLQHLHLHVRTLPDIGEIAGGKISVNDLREVQIEDLLGRDPVAANDLLVSRTVLDRTVLVTGAGGSIGSELCRQIQHIGARRLILLDISEYALYAIERELRIAAASTNRAKPEIIPVLGSVCDGDQLKDIMACYRPETVFHAAAYKHVPLVEANPLQGIRNNIGGTLKLLEAAQGAGVADFILVSTDKAVRPTNIMGATKRAAEQLVQAYAERSAAEKSPGPRYSMVRFGNVLGSSGSVVPLFRQQIEAGGPITLTHRQVTRYFMTIPEAAQLVIQASGLAKGGEVFVLDMGEPVRIVDLARSMIELSGLAVRDDRHPDGDIEIVEIGLRPGEKLFEELLIGNDPQPTMHERISMAREDFLPLGKLRQNVERLLILDDEQEALALLRTLVPDFVHRRDNQGPLAASS